MAKPQSPSEMKKVFEDVLDILQSTAQMDTKNTNVDDLLHQMEHALESLSEKADSIYQKTGMSKDQLEEYTNNSSNFTKEEWALLEQIRGELNKYKQEAEKVMGVDLQTARRQAAAQHPGEEFPPKKPGKGKKNWMPT